MRLGDLLLRDGRITPAQIDAALAHQARVGGRLGTAFVELRLVDPDTLSVYLGLELGIPVAPRSALERAKRAAVRMLKPAQAERHCCVPLVLQDRQLIVAMRDPHDLVSLDELAEASGQRIIPRVAAEVLLYYFIERYYGVPRPARFRAIGDWIAAKRRPAADDVEPPAPPLPGLPPPTDRPIRAPTGPAPALRAIAVEDDEEPSAAAAGPARAPAAPEPEPEAEVAQAGDGATEPGHAEAAAAAPPPPTPEAALLGAPERPRLSLDEALARMASATSRGEVAEAMLGYARTSFPIAAILVVRESFAVGWRGYGPDLDLDRLEALLIPLEARSVFHSAVEASDVWAGAAPPSALHAHLFKVLRARAPRQAVVVPILIRERIVNLLYAHRDAEEPLSDDDRDALRRLAAAAAEAYVRLIALQKHSG